MYRLIQKYYPDGSTALNLDMIVHNCINFANEYYGTHISLSKNDNRILIKEDISALSAHIIQMLEVACLIDRRAVVDITADKSTGKVTVDFVCNGVSGDMILEFDIYDGIPSNVISDKDTENVLDELIRELFAKVQKVRKAFNDINPI